jgi:hypothetical protein
MYRTKVIEKIKTHIWLLVTPPPENRAVYEITWKNIAERGRPKMTIWPMRIACWIPKATNTRTQIVQYSLLFPLQQWLHERASMLRYALIAFLVDT